MILKMMMTMISYMRQILQTDLLKSYIRKFHFYCEEA